MGKTETIIQRRVYAYLPSMKRKKEWKELAEKQGVKLSKFIVEHVENSLNQEDPGYKSRAEMQKKISDLKKENEELRKDNKIKRIVIDRQEEELRRYRSLQFLEKPTPKVREYDRDLIDLLRKENVVTYDQILEHLKIDPRDSDVMKAISVQLETLEDYGIVQSTQKGWRWIG